MDMQKLKWIIPAALVGLALAVWGVLQYMGNKAEERLLDTLSEYGLEHRVRWQDISASLGGGVTLKDVRIDVMEDAVRVKADVVKVSDLTDTKDRQRLTLQVEGLMVAFDDGQDASPLTPFVGLPFGNATLSSMDAELKFDLRYDKDEAELALTVKQKDALDLEYRMQLEKIKGVRDLALAAASDNLMALLPNPRRAQVMPGWLGIQLKSVDLTVEDRGVVKRGIALFKRHNIPLDPDGGSIKSQQNKGFDLVIKEMEAQCRKDRNLRTTLKDMEQACRAITRFVGDDGRTLRISIAPRRPVPIIQILAGINPMFASMSNAPPLSPQALNIEVKS